MPLLDILVMWTSSEPAGRFHNTSIGGLDTAGNIIFYITLLFNLFFRPIRKPYFLKI